ncbi:hypothetical protein A0128_01575 [Leptospira tipperaryensis]|uniref:ATP-grasp domain-containing protein n=1 Tax=Leptospira tipperaryensis TaxID=2564040 RepID=A0A1D7USR7_9LEPT|nr:hypothetical protein [Leptospira tipperaryensis]AOP32672.1 hypothetical protein A0128_01575 [Leptospira tipperaryensis]
MTRYSRFNGFFEEELKTGEIAPEKLDFKNRTLENLFYLFQSLRDRQTVSLLSEAPDPGWVRFWESRGIQLSPIQFLKRNSKKNLLTSPVEKDFIWEEWGSISDLNSSGEILYSSVKADLSKRLNSKILLTLWKSEMGFQDIDAKVLERISHLSALSGEWSEFPPERIVLKPEFSFSGRHKILKFNSFGSENSEGIESEKDRSWFPCVVEPWVKRTSDFSCLYDWNAGVPTSKGSTIQICDEKGKYNGAFLPSEKESERIQSHLQPIVEALSKSFSPDYSGPVSLDGFEFHSQNKTKMRRLSEGNFRWSMGRILFELSRSEILLEAKLITNPNLAILPLPLKRPIPEFSEWIFEWGISQGIEILPLTPDRFSNGKTYGTAWILLGFQGNSAQSMYERIQKFYLEWRKKILL